VQGHVEVMQLDAHPRCPGSESFLVPFDSRPVAPFQDHALTVGEELLGESPQLCLEKDSKLVVPHVVTQLSRPLVLVQPDRGTLRRELAAERRLARGWKPTDQNEPCR